MSVRESTGSQLPAVIVGAGPVGLYTAFQLGLRGVRPVIVESLAFAGGQLSALYPDDLIHDAPGATDLRAGDLAARLGAQLSPFRPLHLFGRRATAIWGALDSGFSVETDTGETITGGAVIFAGGAGAMRPRRLMAEGADSVGPDSLSYDPAAGAEGRVVAVIGDGARAVDAALAAAPRAKRVTLIHALPLRADPQRLERLRAAANAGLGVVQGEVAAIRASGGRVSSVEVQGAAGRVAHDVDLMLVQAGLEFAKADVTGLTPAEDPSTGETATQGVFIVGDALAAAGRQPVLASGFAEALRAAEAAAYRLLPGAPRILPHSALSPTLRARLNVA